MDSAVEAIKSGAFDYLTKPIHPDELVLLIKRAVETQQKDKEIDSLRRRLDQKFGLDQIIGQSKQMKDVFAKIQRAAPVDSTVLILGESGTGKELVAQALHHNSNRKKGPFVAVNCAAVPATLVESELFGHVQRRISPARPTAASAVSSRPTAEHCSSTKLATSSWVCRQSCCVCWKR